jgi:hypothetical protein
MRLWGKEFDEATASMFDAHLRQVGLRVKVVGLSPPPIKGERGLALVPDMTLSQALETDAHTICVIIPCESQYLKHLKNDPRINQFFEQVQRYQAKFVIKRVNKTKIDQLGLFSATDNIIMYPDGDAKL